MDLLGAAAEGSGCLLASTAGWTVVGLARDDDGRAALGAGELRATFAVSAGKVPTTGEPVIDGDMPAVVRLEESNNVSSHTRASFGTG